MNIKRTLTLDLGSERSIRVIPVCHEDSYTRILEISFTNQGIPWPIPDNAAVLIRYRKPDGTEGTYDTLPDGTAAWRIADNKLTVILAPQVCSVPGSVTMFLTLIQGVRQLSTFPICLQVSNPLPGGEESQDYTNLSLWMEQWMQSHNLTSDQIADEIEAYLLDHPIETEETDPTVPAWAKQPKKPTYTASEVGALPNTTVMPTVPTKVSAFTNDAGYLTKHQDISGKLDKNQGSANVGKILMVGTDGNLVLTDLPEAAAGDVVGVLDESNNILLTGAGLADGTYSLKFENHNGEVTEVGDLVVTTIVPPSYTNLAQPVQVGRIKSTGAIDSSASDVRVTAPIPVAVGDVIRVKGLDLTTNNIGFYSDLNGAQLNGGMGTAKLSGWTEYVSYTTSGDIYTITVNKLASQAISVRFSGTPLSGYADSDIVVTVNEPIV